MNAKYVRSGNTIEYVNTESEAIEGGDVIKVGNNIAVAGSTIKPGETGALHITGVFEMEKDSGAIKVGDTLYLDEGNGHVTATKGSLLTTAGIAVSDAAASDTIAQVKLNGWS